MDVYLFCMVRISVHGKMIDEKLLSLSLSHSLVFLLLFSLCFPRNHYGCKSNYTPFDAKLKLARCRGCSSYVRIIKVRFGM